jgi:hypothetical protein
MNLILVGVDLIQDMYNKKYNRFAEFLETSCRVSYQST